MAPAPILTERTVYVPTDDDQALAAALEELARIGRPRRFELVSAVAAGLGLALVDGLRALTRAEARAERADQAERLQRTAALCEEYERLGIAVPTYRLRANLTSWRDRP